MQFSFVYRKPSVVFYHYPMNFGMNLTTENRKIVHSYATVSHCVNIWCCIEMRYDPWTFHLKAHGKNEKIRNNPLLQFIWEWLQRMFRIDVAIERQREMNGGMRVWRLRWRKPNFSFVCYFDVTNLHIYCDMWILLEIIARVSRSPYSFRSGNDFQFE